MTPDWLVWPEATYRSTVAGLSRDLAGGMSHWCRLQKCCSATLREQCLPNIIRFTLEC